jgi:hypothetical protein
MELDNIQEFDEVIIPRGMRTTFGESRIIFSTNCRWLNLPSFQEWSKCFTFKIYTLNVWILVKDEDQLSYK